MLLRKKIFVLALSIYLAQCTSFLWIWHIHTDAYHHPQHQSEHKEHQKSPHNDDSDCPICDQLLKTLGSVTLEPEVALFYQNILWDDPLPSSRLCPAQPFYETFQARPPPLC